MFQHQGGLAYFQQQYNRAANLYQRALKLFQEIKAEDGVMQTCNLLGLVEHEQGRLDEARSWYERSREIARRLESLQDMAIAAQNIGILCQKEGETARRQGNEPVARQRFEEAKNSIQEAVSLTQKLNNKPYEAMTLGQLARIHLLLGELDEAERHAHQALEIRKRFGIKEVHRIYATLADIARARGNATQDAEWERKRDTVPDELDRRARGSGGLPPQLLQAMLTQMAAMPASLSDLAGFLRRLA